MALTILMAGDVESNPGPRYDFQVLQGSIHQGDSIFSPASRGKQCMPCSISFLTHFFIKPVTTNNWNIEDMDQILYMGDYIYKFTKNSMHVTHEYLQINEMPSLLQIAGTTLSWRVTKSYSGNIREGFCGVYPLLNLELAVTMCFSKSTHSSFAVFLCKGNAVGIAKHLDNFFIFDSHARNTSGLIDDRGKCTLICKNSLAGLCRLLRDVIRSLSGNRSSLNEQYDLYEIHISEVAKQTVKNSQSKGHIICSLPNNLEDMSKAWQLLLSTVSRDEHTDHTNSGERQATCMVPIRLVDLPFLQTLPGNHTEPRHNKNSRRHVAYESENLDFSFCRKRRRTQNSTEQEYVIENFDNKISFGPDYVCTSCRQTFFRHSVSVFYPPGIPPSLKSKCITGTVSVNNKEWICNQCASFLRKRLIPPCSIGNKLLFPEIPSELIGLTHLEFRLLSPRIPFMQIRELPRGGQLGIKGNVVNVPADVSNTVNILPRNLDATETIPLKLKRSLCYKSHTVFENIRPQRVIEAAEWLVKNSKLFQNEGIVLNKSWCAETTNSRDSTINEESQDTEMSNPSHSSVHPDTEMSNSSHISVYPDTEMSNASHSSVHPDTEMPNASRSSVHADTEISNASHISVHLDTEMPNASRGSVHPDTEMPNARGSLHPDTEIANAPRSSIHPNTEMSHASHSSVHPDPELSHASHSSVHPDTEMSNASHISVHPDIVQCNVQCIS